MSTWNPERMNMDVVHMKKTKEFCVKEDINVEYRVEVVKVGQLKT
jgi:hypothetical protein